ncbi:MAG: heavy metal-binding domain-containing protein [Acidobacteriota bacterium]
MIRKTLVLTAALLCILFAVSCGNPASEKAEATGAPSSEPAPAAPASEPAAAPANVPAAHPSDRVYVCEMGCEIAHEPGQCPKCGMTMKEVQASDISYECGKCGASFDKPGTCQKCDVVLNFKIKGQA